MGCPNSRPVAVLISDVHYNIATLPLADAAMNQAIAKSNELKIPLVVAGDLHDTKANLRGECTNAMLETFRKCEQYCYILRGNHDSLNEKSEESALNFLERIQDNGDWDNNPSIEIVNDSIVTRRITVNHMKTHLVPYHSNPQKLKAYLNRVDAGSCVIMHQGVTGANMGDYVQDKSSISSGDVEGLRVISGHYHGRQTIHWPRGGSWSYIGNPYTLSWGEAQDMQKGFQILYSNGSLEFVPTNLRKHVVVSFIYPLIPLNLAEVKQQGDLIWVKMYGNKEDLAKCTREVLTTRLGITDFKLDKFPDALESVAKPISKNQSEILDSIIEGLMQISPECKVRLKDLWKGLA
jgi:DNA repair exonuclease SbcCD nuclease subunit